MEYKIYRDDVTIVGDSEVELLVAEEVPEGYVLEITHMAIIDWDSDDKRLELGYVSQTEVYKVLAADRRENKYSHYLTGTAWLMAGEAPYGRVTTAEDGDAIHFSCHGKLWPIK